MTQRQADRIERKLDALALTLGGPARRDFDKIGWATRAAANRSARRRDPGGPDSPPKVAG